MPADFDKCVKEGGRVRTLENGHLICYPKGGGPGIVGGKRDGEHSAGKSKKKGKEQPTATYS